MPEGHTLHGLAREHRRLLAGRTIRVSSPQGPFASDAALVDGARLVEAEAYGKHLFHHWSTGHVGHVHLGLFGKFRTHRGAEAPAPTGAVRMRLHADGVTVDLSGPTACTIGTPEDRARIIDRLGPDPLRRDADPDRAIHRMGASTRPIGALLLDQSVLSGIGNVFRAEMLFVCGIHPLRPGAACSLDDRRTLWDTAVAMLRAGLRANRIVTVSHDELGLPRRARIPRSEATYVYGRDRCIRCGSPVHTLEVGNRTCYFCPVHQPG